nr:ribonuclease H-like domain-containing protein [Tanacetum cinerariifolium]
MMALPDKHQLKFNIHKDVKSLMEAIEKRFGGNKETKKVQKTLLKQQYENFSGTSSESLDQIHDRLRKLISQLEILGDSISQEDINLKFLRSLPQLDDEDLKQIDADDLEEMDLKWQMAMHTMRARRFLQKTERNLGVNETAAIGFDMSKVECYNCHRRGLFARECRSPRDNRNKDTPRRTVPVEADEEPTNYALMAYALSGSSSSLGSDNEVAPCSKACSKAYATLQSHYDKLTFNFRKSQFDVLSYKAGLESVEARLVMFQENENMFEEEIKLLKLDVMLRDNALVKLRNKFEKAEKEKDDLKLTLETFQTSSKNLNKWLESQVNDKTGLGYDSQVCNSQVFDCEESGDSVPKSPVNDRYKSDKGYHAFPPPYNRTFMPLKPNLVFNDTLNASETVTNVVNVESSLNNPSNDISKTLRPDAPIIEDWISDSKDETEIESLPKQKEPSFVLTSEHVKTPRESVKKVKHPTQAENLRTTYQKSKGHKNSWNRKACFVCKSLNHLIKDCDYYEKQMGNPQQALKDKCVIDSGCSRHTTGNISFLSDFKEINEGYVAFRENPKGGKITGKGKIKTGKLDFDDVYFVKELKFNLFSVSQMCDKKNNVLFTDTEYVVLSSDYKLPDENHVLLRVPKENKMYNVDLNNVVPLGDLTCLFAKATLDESNLWHRRLGHINFKTMNKLVKGYLVRGLPSNIFENNHTCVACQKSKNYQSVVVGNQPNRNAGIKENLNADANVDDAAFDVKENENEVHVSPSKSDKTGSKKHDEKAKRDDKGKSVVGSPTGVRDLRAKFEDFSSSSTNRVNAVSTHVTAAGPNPTNSTNSFNTANMPALEDIVYSDDDEDVGTEADLSNLETDISRIEAIQLFLAYASFVGFMVYQMDVKSAFLYETIKEEVYVCQPPGFKDPDYPDKTLFIKKQKGDILLVQVYVDDIIFGSTNKELFKRIFRYLKGKPHLGLWYPKDSSFNLVAYSDSDYAGASLDRKSTTGGCQFLDCSMISWQCKKLTVVATSSTEAEYVAAASCCAQVLWIQNQLLDYGIDGFHSTNLMRKMELELLLYALVINPTIYVSCIKQFWASTTIKKVNDAVQLRSLINGKKVVVTEDVIRSDIRLDDADGVECLPNKEIFAELARMGYEKLPPKLTFYNAFFSTQWKFLIHILVQCVSATTWNEFSCSMASAVICLATAEEEENDVEVPTASTPPSPTPAPSSPADQDPTPTPHTTPHALPSSPTQGQPTKTSKSSIPLLNTLVETCATLSQKVAELEQDKHTQALEILKLKKMVKKLEKKKSKSSGLKRLRKVGTSQRVESFNDTVVDVETQVDMDAELQGRIGQDVSAVEPTVFDDEEVTITMAQNLIKMKAEKAKLFDEKIAKRVHDEEVKKVAAMKKQEKDDLERAKVLQQHLKKKPVSIAQARKNMIIYLKNMAGYKMEHFREEPQKKRVTEETLIQESFKKLKAVEVSDSHSTPENSSNDPKEMSEEDVQNMFEIVPVSEFKVEALQVNEKKFSSAVPKEDKEKALWVELTRLFAPNADDIFWKLQKKDYPLSNVVMIMMLSVKLQVEEHSEMARDLVMKIFMEANKPKSKSLDTSSK